MSLHARLKRLEGGNRCGCLPCALVRATDGPRVPATSCTHSPVRLAEILKGMRNVATEPNRGA